MKPSVFVKLDDYNDIAEILDVTRQKLKEAKMLFDRINEVKSREDEELAKWQRDLGDVEARVGEISGVFEKE